MTRTLILIRHAKSDWGDPGLSDHDRPLNKRGQLSAPRIGRWLSQQGVSPDEVLCSTATRTQETWAGIAPFLPDAPDPTREQSLYLASPNKMLAALRGAQGRTVALIGHNPGSAALAQCLAASPPDHSKFGHYPTGATAIIRFDIDDWSALLPGTGQVIGFAVPRELPDPA